MDLNIELPSGIKFYSMDDFGRIEKIDMHLHVNTFEHTLIKQAVKDNFKILTINVDYHAFPPVKEQLDIAVSFKKEFPGAFAFATTFYMEGWDNPGWQDKTIDYINKTISMGACAVKVWKNIGMDFRDKHGKLIMIDDAKFDPVFEHIKKMNIPLIGHLGEPKDCWLPTDKMIVNYIRDYFTEHPEYHMHAHPELPSYEDQITARNNALKKNNELVFVGAHFASLEWSVDEIAAFLDAFPYAVVDSAARMGEIQFQTSHDREKVRDFFIKYQDRIMYATDTFQLSGADDKAFMSGVHNKWLSDWQYFTSKDEMNVSDFDEHFYGIQLPAPVIDKIYRTNAERVFHSAWK